MFEARQEAATGINFTHRGISLSSLAAPSPDDVFLIMTFFTRLIRANSHHPHRVAHVIPILYPFNPGKYGPTLHGPCVTPIFFFPFNPGKKKILTTHTVWPMYHTKLFYRLIR